VVEMFNNQYSILNIQWQPSLKPASAHMA